MPNKRGSKLKTADEGVARTSVTESGFFLVRKPYFGNADFAARVLNLQTVIGTIFLQAIRARATIGRMTRTTSSIWLGLSRAQDHHLLSIE